MPFRRRPAAVLDRDHTPRTLADLDHPTGEWITLADLEGVYSGHLLDVEHDPTRCHTVVQLRSFKGETPHDVNRGFPSDTPIEVAR
jgi:hypothetical protein